jgi:hypothetical protein
MTLSPLLEHFWSVLPPSLVTTKAMEKLQLAAKFFPPVSRIGIECRMGQDHQVDIQQCLLRDRDDLLQIQMWLQTQESHDRTDWHDFSLFLEEWCTVGSYYNQYIPEIFLELDLLPGNIRTPLLFLAVDPDISFSNVEMMVERLIGHRHLGLSKCLLALPPRAKIHFIGIPFSRNKEHIRINIANLSYTEVLPMLAALGWGASSFDEEIWQAFQHTDRVRVCVDMGQYLLPNLGLECIWDDQPAQDARWTHFLDYAEKQGLCLKNKAYAVVNWENSYFPHLGTPWPAPYWLRSLTRGEHEFTYLKTKVSHLKVSLGKERSLKAYLGYGQLWHKNTPPAVKPSSPAPDLSTGIEKGLDFLLRSQKPSGAWIDFKLPAGKSDEWVTAYVAYFLSNFPGTEVGLENAAEFLKKRFISGKGWGNNLHNVRDADSSIWAHMFLSRMKKSLDSSFLTRYKSLDGGVHTYVDLDKEMQVMTGLPPHALFTGWKSVHPCVTAAYALSGDSNAKHFLIKNQHPDGYVPAYWWSTPAYATALAVEAMEPTEMEFLLPAAAWAERQYYTTEKTPFGLAQLLRILHFDTQKSTLKKQIIAEILSVQREDGSFEGSAGLRIPKPNQVQPSENDPVYQDQNGLFTTVSVLYTLHLISKNI